MIIITTKRKIINKKMNKKKRYILLTKILVLFSINLAYIRGKLPDCKAKTGRIALNSKRQKYSRQKNSQASHSRLETVS